MQPLRTRRARNPINDPAPSVLSYRLLRLMLTPVLRRLVVYGIPAFVVTLGVGLYFAKQENRDYLYAYYQDVYRSVIERPEFMVKLMSITGASDDVDQDIREVVPLDFPISSFDLDLKQMQQSIAALDPIRDAKLFVRSNVLEIEVTEREPALLWRHSEGIEVLDIEGNYVRSASTRLDYPTLPLIAGRKADENVMQARQLLAAARPLQDRLRGLVYVGERRWDVVLDRDQVLMLPSDNPIRALERIIALDHAQELLQRDIAAVDFRIAERPTLRVVTRDTDLISINSTQSGDP